MLSLSKHALAVALFAGAFMGTASAASDPMASVGYLVGTWTCTYHQGPSKLTYKAIYGYDMGGNWMRERDSWAGGGSDEGSFTYDPSHREWITVVLEKGRDVTLFHAKGTNAAHIVYRGVYPNTDLTDIFDRISRTRYELHFSGTLNGKHLTSHDVCVKS